MTQVEPLSEDEIVLCVDGNHGPWKYEQASAILRCERCRRTAVAAWQQARTEIDTLRSSLQTAERERDEATGLHDRANTAALELIAERESRIKALTDALRELPDAVPTNWLDSILTGPERAFDDKAAREANVQNVLLAVKKRIAAIVDSALTDPSGKDQS